jgi:F-type H+-transporting ATPase subunit a
MPKHTYWLTYLLDMFPALKTNARNIGNSILGNQEPGYRSTEPVLTSMLYMIILLVLAVIARRRIMNVREASVPSDKLTLVTFFEVFIGYFYDLAKGVMGPERAKRFFPIIGGSALFIIFSNLIGLLPGFGSPTSSLNVTLGCALVVLATFNYYGLKENGWHYVAHFAGPKWYLAPLMVIIEVPSTLIIRPVTLAIRLMVNIAVDHLLGALFLGLVTLFVPIPIIMLGLIVCVVQTVVFCLLTSVYIGLATEPHEHEGGHAHGHDEAHAH